METSLVVVSIVNWNTPARTLECLAAVGRLDYPNLHAIVVDNASRDDSVARLRAAGSDVIVATDNGGFAAGHALAWREAERRGADAIWLLNSDALVEPDALAALMAARHAHGDAIYGGLPLRRGADAATIDFPEKFLDPAAKPRPWRRDRALPFDAGWRGRAPFRVGAVSGVSMLLPLALIARHGWLDASWFMYCEEIDYCLRLREAGVACWLVPGARAWHARRGSQHGRPGVADVMRYYGARNEIRLARRHAGATVAAIIATKKFARALATLPRAPRSARWLLRGGIDGIRDRGGRIYAPDDVL
ncbi:glycosyltransferase family 2 protein [Dokdonella sp.]|uniref:glycosyltransferase family 2 protein n=1 Tax=Dokdonella sp. TaxID=2291710 RepID=UPI003F7ED414